MRRKWIIALMLAGTLNSGDVLRVEAREGQVRVRAERRQSEGTEQAGPLVEQDGQFFS